MSVESNFPRCQIDACPNQAAWRWTMNARDAYSICDSHHEEHVTELGVPRGQFRLLIPRAVQIATQRRLRELAAGRFG